MSAFAKCPECQKQLRIADNFFGKQVRCPACKTVFIAEEPEAPAEEGIPLAGQEDETSEPPSEDTDQSETDDEEGGEPRPKKKRKKTTEAWRKVRTGMTIICAGIVLFVCLIAGGAVLGGVIGARQGAQGIAGNPQMAGLQKVTGLLGLGIDILLLAGYGFCLSVPQKENARGLAITTFALASVGILMAVVAQLLIFLGGAPAPGGAVGAGAGLLALVVSLLAGCKQLTFLFFLRSVALALHDDDLAHSVRNFLIFAVILFVGFVLFLCVSAVSVIGIAAAAPGGPGGPPGGGAQGFAAILVLVMGLGMCIGVIAMIIAAIWYIRLLFRTRGVIDARVGDA